MAGLVRVVALVNDLMDRSRISSAIPNVVFVRSVGEIDNADVVVIDIARGAEFVTAARVSAPGARIVAFGPHVDVDTMDLARSAGADEVFARSKFFRHVRDVVLGPSTGR
jgi:hypothetical protein